MESSVRDLGIGGKRMASGIPEENCGATGVCAGRGPADEWQSGRPVVFCNEDQEAADSGIAGRPLPRSLLKLSTSCGRASPEDCVLLSGGEGLPPNRVPVRPATRPSLVARAFGGARPRTNPRDTRANSPKPPPVEGS